MYYFKKLSLCYLIVGVIFLTGCSKDPGTPPVFNTYRNV